MAVFTKLLKEDIENFISEYSIGNLDSFEEIVDGIENSNFKIFCNNQPYILTIFEKRVTEQELPFFINLKNFLNKNNFKCPKAISDKNGKILKRIKNKTAVIISFLEGKSIEEPNSEMCREVGKMVADLHNLTINFDEKRPNSLDLQNWKEIYKKCLNNKSEKFGREYRLQFARYRSTVAYACSTSTTINWPCCTSRLYSYIRLYSLRLVFRVRTAIKASTT